MKKKIYLSGPITGVSDYREKFAKAEKAFADKYEVVNPVAIGEVLQRLRRELGAPEPEWKDYMKPCIQALVGCDAIVLLDGWKNSKGARLEKFIAEELMMYVFTWDDGCPAYFARFF